MSDCKLETKIEFDISNILGTSAIRYIRILSKVPGFEKICIDHIGSEQSKMSSISISYLKTIFTEPKTDKILKFLRNFVSTDGPVEVCLEYNETLNEENAELNLTIENKTDNTFKVFKGITTINQFFNSLLEVGKLDESSYTGRFRI